MISKQSIGLAELIVAGTGLPVVKSAALIRGLNQEAVGAVGYGDDFRNEIVQTTQNTAHSALLDLTSDKLAEVIREAMYNIRDYGVPFARKVADDVRVLYSGGHLATVANTHVHIRYIPVDNPFFDSPLYPAAVTDKLLSYEAVDLDPIGSLKVRYPDEEEVLKYIGSSHPDLQAVLDDTECSLGDAAHSVLSLGNLSYCFEKNGGVFNFKKIKSLKVSQLVKMYVILTRMYASEDPVPWLTGGELTTYRRMVNLLWNGMTAYLIELKKLFAVYRARRVVIMMQETPAITEDRSSNTRIMKLSAQVLYTREFMDKLAYNNVSFNELVVGYAWSHLVGNRAVITDVIDSPEKVVQFAKQYYSTVDLALKDRGRQVFIETGLKAISAYLFETPVVSERFKEILGKGSEVPGSWITRTFNKSLEECYYRIAEDRKASSYEDEVLSPGNPENTSFADVILQSNLVGDFLKALNCHLAAEILNATFVNRQEEDNIHEKRQRLHVALINMIVNMSIEVA